MTNKDNQNKTLGDTWVKLR